MTKVSPCYSLCPLIEQKNFLGVTKDVDDDTVLVTTNSNIIGRYRVSDPKQISSWNSKGSLTSATVYDVDCEQYIAVFNHNEIRLWKQSDDSIDRVKKYKFSEKIIGLLISPKNGKVIVVFAKGYVSYLSQAIETRKNTFPSSHLKEKENICFFEIADLEHSTLVIFLATRSSKSFRIFGTSCESEGSVFFNISSKYSKKLVGYCLLCDTDLYFVSLWSDGKLYRDCIFPTASVLPSNNIATVDVLNLKKRVAMKMLSPHCMAICGLKDDGIMLIIYSIKFNLVECRQFYENCSSLPQLWNYHSKIFLIIGHNLVVVPYAEEQRKLSSLVGSKILPFDPNETEAFPEADVSNNLLPQLLENNESRNILEIIDSRCDITDSVLIDVILWVLKEKDSRIQILDSILNNYCTAGSGLSRIRLHCTVHESLVLLDYIMSNLNRSNDSFKLLKWASLFVDAFYQQYLMSNDKSIVDKLNEYLIILKKETDYVRDIEALASALSCIQRAKPILSK